MIVKYAMIMTKLLNSNQAEIINAIKLLIYKENQTLLEKVDFDDDDVFLEPLLFAYFNSRNENLFSTAMLKEIMQGYFIKKEEIEINYSFNINGIGYIPKLGYFIKGEKIPFESNITVRDTNIEILKYPLSLLQNIFRISSTNLINEDEIIIDSDLFEKNILPLTNAFQFIKESSVEHFKLITQCCKKCVLFKTNPENINSFATIYAHGIAFFNVYQDDYDEVFFVDDIAHQTGHIILNTLFHNRKIIFNTDENQNIGKILKKKDRRSIYVLLHAFYTYYTTMMCLDTCLENNLFNEKQKKEAIARVGFYLEKISRDFQNFEKVNIHFFGIENVLTESGIQIYSMIEAKYHEVFEKWNSVTKHFDYSNQTYNFTFKNFAEINTK